KNVETKRIFITYPDMDDNIVDMVEKAILEEHPFKEVLRSNAGCTVASHCGPKTLGILFYEAE
ncbi:MAG: DegV family protein, partial [Clostridia bacterium]|nr:DegV family protein [Clostridia bacterium]